MNEGNVSSQKRRPFKKMWFVLLLLLPTLFSVLLFRIVNNNVTDSSENIYNIKLFDLEGNTLAEEKNLILEAEKDGIISIFFPITENLTTKEQIPEAVDRTKGFIAVVDYMDVKNEYTLYFSLEDMAGYCVFNGESYRLSDTDTRKILTSTFSQSLYENAKIPQLFTISGEPIIPQSVWWSYSMVSGDYAMVKDAKVTSDLIVYDMSGALGLSFDKAPSECNITITKDQQTVYNGAYEDISQLSFEKGDLLHIYIAADWLYSSSAEYYGNATYSFNVTISDRAEFYLTDDTYAINSVCGIFCYNVKDASKIIFECTPSLPIGPEFNVSGSTTFALFPIPKETEVGKYKITLTYGAASEEFTLNIIEDDASAYVESNIEKNKIDKAFKNSVVKGIDDLKRFADDNSNGEKLFFGEFLELSKLGAYKASKFGDVYNNPYREYYSEGNEYRFLDQTGVRVPVLNSGQVIKTGYNEQLGNYVIVSHGCGLSTWYAHLSNIDVIVGSYVVKGETLGKTGTTGLSEAENVVVFAFLYGRFIDPSEICGKSFDGMPNQ